MSSKRRLRRKSCEGKVQHATQGAAHAHVRSLLASQPESGSLGVYKCKWGEHWHVGHRPGSRRLFTILFVE